MSLLRQDYSRIGKLTSLGIEETAPNLRAGVLYKLVYICSLYTPERKEDYDGSENTNVAKQFDRQSIVI